MKSSGPFGFEVVVLSDATVVGVIGSEAFAFAQSSPTVEMSMSESDSHLMRGGREDASLVEEVIIDSRLGWGFVVSVFRRIEIGVIGLLQFSAPSLRWW